METTFNHQEFLNNIETFGLSCSDEQLASLETYAKLLVEWNQKMNLTAITSPEGIAVLHFADSLSFLSAFPLKGDEKVLDIGTGAGFPAIPLKIMNPTVNFTLMDSLNKRLTFLREVLNTLSLNATLLHSRAEERARDKKMREQFDVVTARAVASMEVLAEYALPYVRLGGHFVAMKGPSCQEELEKGANAIATLGGKVVRVVPFTLSDGSARYIAIIEKVKKTPDVYPRHGSKIAKKPL